MKTEVMPEKRRFARKITQGKTRPAFPLNIFSLCGADEDRKSDRQFFFSKCGISRKMGSKTVRSL